MKGRLFKHLPPLYPVRSYDELLALIERERQPGENCFINTSAIYRKTNNSYLLKIGDAIYTVPFSAAPTAPFAFINDGSGGAK